jgi:hypothetical protein
MALRRHLIFRAGQQPAEHAGCGQPMQGCHVLDVAPGDEDVRVGRLVCQVRTYFSFATLTMMWAYGVPFHIT